MSSNQKFSISASDRYALALFELAQEESQLDRIEKEAEEFKKLIKKNDDINFLKEEILKVKNRYKLVLKGKSITNDSINRWFNSEYLKKYPNLQSESSLV